MLCFWRESSVVAAEANVGGSGGSARSSSASDTASALSSPMAPRSMRIPIPVLLGFVCCSGTQARCLHASSHMQTRPASLLAASRMILSAGCVRRGYLLAQVLRNRHRNHFADQEGAVCPLRTVLRLHARLRLVSSKIIALAQEHALTCKRKKTARPHRISQ